MKECKMTKKIKNVLENSLAGRSSCHVRPVLFPNESNKSIFQLRKVIISSGAIIEFRVLQGPLIK